MAISDTSSHGIGFLELHQPLLNHIFRWLRDDGKADADRDGSGDALIGHRDKLAYLEKLVYDSHDRNFSRLLSTRSSSSIWSRYMQSHEKVNIHTDWFGDDGRANADKDKTRNSITTRSKNIVQAHVSGEVNRKGENKYVRVHRFDEDVNTQYCYHCKKSTDEGSTHEGTPLHLDCYKERFHPKCYVCKSGLPTESDGNLTGFRYIAHPFWAQQYCPSHEDDETLKSCYSCELLLPWGTEHVVLNDGRIICPDCGCSAVKDTDQCRFVKFDVSKFYDELNMKVEQDVPLFLVGHQVLNKAKKGVKYDRFRKEDTWGLCILQEATEPQEPYRVTPEVEEILVLSGLPWLMTGFVIAHEMMHAWLWLNGFRAMRLQVEEGMCQVMGYKWLESKLGARYYKTSHESSNTASTSSSLSSFEAMLGEFFMHKTMTNPDPTYGEGFRAAQLAVKKHGLEETLQHIQNTGKLPAVR